ncbi:TPA: hypothetical protein DIC40_05705 [Patescibacteria group bacterium]|nr:hypothetical protein [Candidatus Gracilibacteria bacterium]
MFLVYNKEITPLGFASALGTNKNWFIGFENNNFLFFSSGAINVPNYRENNIFKIISVASNNTGTAVAINNKPVSIEQTPLIPTNNLSLGKINEDNFAL